MNTSKTYECFTVIEQNFDTVTCFIWHVHLIPSRGDAVNSNASLRLQKWRAKLKPLLSSGTMNALFDSYYVKTMHMLTSAPPMNATASTLQLPIESPIHSGNFEFSCRHIIQEAQAGNRFPTTRPLQG